MPTIDLGSVVGPQGAQGNTGPQGEQGVAGPSLISASTQTTLTGVLAGDGSTVGVRAVDATPTNNSTNLVSSGGVYTKIANDVAASYQRTCNPNLLDNWYFPNAVNQRGQSSYIGNSGYTIDRWVLVGTTGTASFDASGMSLSNNTAESQYIETSSVISGNKYTLSILWSDGLQVATGTLTIGAGTGNWLISTGTIGNPKITAIRQYGSGTFQIAIWGNGTSKVIAIKLELGNAQTLCHNEGTDANPVWVLNEVPNYGEQLERCITSHADSSDTYANKPLNSVLLWTNLNMGSSFSNQSVSINTSPYKILIFTYRVNTNASSYFDVVHGNDGQYHTHSFVASPASGYPSIAFRSVNASSSSVNFGSAETRLFTEASRTTDNSLLIPYKIYGCP